MSLRYLVILPFVVKGQTVCLSGANNVNGWINGEYIRRSDWNGYPSYFQDLSGNENEGCGVSIAFIFRSQDNGRYRISPVLGSLSNEDGHVYGRCNIVSDNPFDCNGNWDIGNSVRIDNGKCPVSNCGSIRTSNSNGAVGCSLSDGYVLNWNGNNAYVDNVVNPTNSLVWNKIIQRWTCISGNGSIGCNAVVEGYQEDPGWINELNNAESVVVDWNINDAISQMTMECIGIAPTITPTTMPSLQTSTPVTNPPSTTPTYSPNISPTQTPTTIRPSLSPTTFNPTIIPSANPSAFPSLSPISLVHPTIATFNPTNNPSSNITPSYNPTVMPSNSPTIMNTIISTNINNDESSTAYTWLFIMSTTTGILLALLFIIICIFLKRKLLTKHMKEPNNIITHHTIQNGEQDMTTIPNDFDYALLPANSDDFSNHTQIKNDERIAKNVQENQFDIHNITSGQYTINDIITKGNNQPNSSPNIHNPSSDTIIAINIAQNEQEIHQYTKGNISSHNWYTKK